MLTHIKRKIRLVLGLALSSFLLGSSLASAPAGIRPKGMVERTAFDYLRNEPDRDLAAYLAKDYTPNSKLSQEITTMVAAMRTVLADGVKIDSVHFWELLDEKLAAAGGAAAAPAVAVPAAASGRTSADFPVASSNNKSPLLSFFHTGVRSLTPYKITVSGEPGAKRATLDANGTSAVGYIEYVLATRWAWSPARVSNYVKDTGGPGIENRREKEKALNLSPFDGRLFDVDMRVSYNFAKGSEKDTSAIVGSGDFGLEVTVSRLLARRLHQDLDANEGAYSIGIDLSYGLNTDRNSFDAHERIVVGPSYTASRAQGERWLLFTSRIGPALLDTVKFQSKATREIALEHDDVPRFRLHPAAAFEVELFYPIGTDATITLGTRAYVGVRPAPWTVYIGYSIPISNLFPSGSKEPAKVPTL